MATSAEVQLWGRTIGAVALRDGAEVAEFEYTPEFAASGIEVAPLTMPLSRRVYAFPELARESFHGLPGLLEDSLPDRFGNALINAWLASQGRRPESFNAVERLCYVGRRGMGALEYRPVLGPPARAGHTIDIEQLAGLASDILTRREQLELSFAEEERGQALTELLRVGTSAGGARAKALIAWNPATDEVRSGQIEAGDGFEYWLLKFDGVSGNRDRELDDPQGYGAIEYACYLMARDCGIGMMPCRLMEEHGRRHFMTRRYDRTPEGRKLHKQSLAALAHFDFNLAGAYSYEQALMIVRRLALPMDQLEQLYRRMVFNVVIRNQDDHVKNIEFLMDPAGAWSLAPAFDMVYSYNPAGAWTARHQMSVNGKRDGFSREDFRDCARTVSMKRGRADTIVAEVQDVVTQWPAYAERAALPDETAQRIQRAFRSIG